MTEMTTTQVVLFALAIFLSGGGIGYAWGAIKGFEAGMRCANDAYPFGRKSP